MKKQFHQQAAINTFVIFTLLWVLVVGYIRIFQGFGGNVSFVGTLVYYDVVLISAIIAGFVYKKKK